MCDAGPYEILSSEAAMTHPVSSPVGSRSNHPKFLRARVAVSAPGRNLSIPDPAAMAVHVGHASTLYLGSLVAQRYGCPFEVRLDGGERHFQADLTPFHDDVEACLDFMGVTPSRIYQQPQEVPSTKWLKDRLGPGGELVPFIEWNTGPLSMAALLDDVENAPSLIIRGEEFKRPEKYVGAGQIGLNMLRYTMVEKVIFSLARVENKEVNLPIITLGGYKMSTSEGRTVHWRALEVIGQKAARQLFSVMSSRSRAWEWDWSWLTENGVGRLWVARDEAMCWDVD